ncbi:MAG: DUF4139 domain-containing protein [Myxococcaceae bacterium]|nr:DUF4139 domain-containing protein [Myxococcaceae bacterium]
MNVGSELETITIYREGAVCTRRAKLDRVDREVRVVGLPLSLVPGSVRGRVLTGPVGLRVLDVRPGFDVEFGDAVDESAETKARDAAKLEVTRLEARFNRLDAELRELQNLKPLPFEREEGAPPRPAPVEATLALTAFVDEKMKQLLSDKRAVEKELKDAREEAQLRERRLAEASAEKRSQKAKVTRAIVLAMSMEAAGPVEIEVEYQVPGVRWVPNYTLRLEKGFQGGALRLRASVAQDTGEDWKGVKLALSTATLLRRTDVPELKSLRIGRTQPQPPKPGFRAPPPGLDELFDGYDTASRPIPPALPTSVSVPTGFAAPPPPPAPPMKPQPRQAEKEKKRAVSYEAPTTEIAAAMPADEDAMPARGRSTGAMKPMAPGAPPPRSAPMASMPAPAAMRRPQAKGGGVFGTVADAIGGAMRDEADDFASLPEEEAEGGWGGDAPTGSGFSPVIPTYTPAEGLLDYDRLRMPGPEVAGARGKLSHVSDFEAVFAVGVSVQVDVVMMLLSTWQQRAMKVASLPVPPRCTLVASFDQFDFRYDCVAPVDVPSTGMWSTVPVMACQVGLTPQYVCVPAVEPKVFRTLAISNATTAALLAGPVEVSVGDEFLMTTTMPAIPPGANTERLGLGVEEAIKVARKTNFAETTGGFLGGSTVLKHDVEIEVNNRLGSPAAIEVRERVPVVPQSEKDIKVEEAEVKPGWEKTDGPVDGVVTAGLRRWRVTVAPGGRSTLTASVLVRIPADKMLVGGNRRS